MPEIISTRLLMVTRWGQIPRPPIVSTTPPQKTGLLAQGELPTTWGEAHDLLGGAPDFLRGMTDRALYAPPETFAPLQFHVETNLPRTSLTSAQKAELTSLLPLCDPVFPIPLGEQQCLVWAMNSFGQDKIDSHAVFRSYAQIDAQQITKAVRIIHEVMQQRISAGKKPIPFKFLVAKVAYEGRMARKWQPADFIDKHSAVIGEYISLDPSDAVIALYAEDLDTTLELLTEISSHPEWETIEQERTSVQRHKGTSSFTNPVTGREWRSLNYNRQPGFAEDLVRNAGVLQRDWRTLVQGTNSADLV